MTIRPIINIPNSFEQAITFNGSTQYASVTSADFNIITSLAMGCWVKLTSAQTGLALMGNDSFRMEIDGTFSTPIFVDAGQFATSGIKSDTLKDLGWHHIVVVYDLSNTYVYQDGQLLSKETHSSSITLPTQAFTLGAKYDASFKTACSMKYAFFCAQSLTSAQVTDIYGFGPTNLGLANYLSALSCKGLWSFNNVYTDLSGRANTLTGTGTPTFAAVNGSAFGRGVRTTA